MTDAELYIIAAMLTALAAEEDAAIATRPQPQFRPLMTQDGGEAAVVSDSIGDGLRAAVTQYWKLDEASGSRINSKAGGVNLADVGSVLSATGNISTLAALVSTSGQELSHADDPVFDLMPNVFTVAVWYYVDSNLYNPVGTQYMTVLGKAFNTVDFILQAVSSGGTFHVEWDFGLLVSSAPLALDTWHLTIVKYQDIGLPNVHIKMLTDNSDLVELDDITSFTSSEPFRIGNDGYNEVFKGRIGHAMIFKGYATSDAEDAYLYNNGAGRTLYP